MSHRVLHDNMSFVLFALDCSLSNWEILTNLIIANSDEKNLILLDKEKHNMQKFATAVRVCKVMSEETFEPFLYINK